ncbi:MAG: tyrosine-type recombinase/integrase [Spirochaetes bacterium]|nr:tyrosine-type recombinase/integrase [Spirochaetota bacterium]
MNFKSEMMSHYNDMLDLKESLGFNRHTYSAHIVQFIEYCSDNYPDVNMITKEMIDSWLSVYDFKTENTRRIAVINVRHFTKYLRAIGKDAFVPDSDYNVKTKRFVPYIFSDEQLKRLFDSIDSVSPDSKTHVEMILPVILRMELCCGMRPNEPLALKTEDVDLKSGDIFIRKSKRGKDRHIIISEDMRRLCEIYDAVAGERDYFFPFGSGKQIPTTWVRYQFSKAWINCDPDSASKIIPRPYDLRHNFATRALMRWIDEKRDVMTLMPFLSEYMGHVSLSETLYYVHLLPERLKKSPNIDWEMMKDIYPHQDEEG